MAHFIESILTYIVLPMGVYVELIITRNILSCFSIFVNFIGHANSVPDGSSPRGYNQELVLGCRLNILVHLVAILSLFPNMIFFFFSLFYLSGARTALPMGVAPEATAKDLCLVVGSRNFYICHTRKFTFFWSSPRAFGQKLVFDQRLPKYWIILSVVTFLLFFLSTYFP